MTLQRRWRDWLNAHVLDQWLTSGRYYQLNLVPGDHTNPEYRVAEDLRLSVDAPVEFSVGVFSAVTSAIVFIGVLWFIGGELTIPIGSTMLRIPGFLVVAAFIYAVLASGSMVMIARGFVSVVREQESGGGGLPVHAHAPPGKRREHRDAGRRATRSAPALTGPSRPSAALARADDAVHPHHHRVASSSGFAPIVPILLCAPKYVAGP